jgi:hypothetical protein
MTTSQVNSNILIFHKIKVLITFLATMLPPYGRNWQLIDPECHLEKAQKIAK